MNRRPLWLRLATRLRREAASVQHAARDHALLRKFRENEFLDASGLAMIASRLAGGPWLPPPLQELLHQVCFGRWPMEPDPDLTHECVAQASEVAAGSCTLFEHRYPLDEADAWHIDPLRSRPWPRRWHPLIRLDDPDHPGDLRMQWEPARFHHGLLLGRAYALTGEARYVETFLRQVDAFASGCPPFRSIHWSVGMEVAIRASAWIFTLALFRGAVALDEDARLRLTRQLLLHGLFLETHLERHDLGFTTNHTLADHAGLAVLGRHFEGTDPGRRWLDLAADGLRACLEEQVLAGGAHAECSLPYERFVLEASLVAALCLSPKAATPLRPYLRAIADHLREVSLADGLPFVGDGDDSFFPPFGFLPSAQRDPLAPGPVLRRADAWLTGQKLQTAPTTGSGHEGTLRFPTGSSTGAGGIRFSAGPFDGFFVVRGRGEGWLPTHGHNDLLSIVLDVDGQPLLIDPGTGGYARDRRLRQQLRSTSAHSTLQLESAEQSEIRERATFEGPASVACGASPPRPNRPTLLAAWHEGFGQGIRHERRLHWHLSRLCIEDLLECPAGLAREPGVTTHLRFRFPPGAVLRLEEEPTPGGPRSSRPRSACVIELPHGTVRFLLLRPYHTIWQIQSGPVSRRYGSVQEAPILVASAQGPWPHRYLTVVDYAPGETGRT